MSCKFPRILRTYILDYDNCLDYIEVQFFAFFGQKIKKCKNFQLVIV
jgi:hypothetical protein